MPNCLAYNCGTSVTTETLMCKVGLYLSVIILGGFNEITFYIYAITRFNLCIIID
jgi:hypothetical protein